jgi:hypothetical protein
MTYEERMKFKQLKQEMEFAIYTNIIDSIMGSCSDYNLLPSKERLEIIMLVSKIKNLENKCNA